MQGYHIDIEQATQDNTDFRRVLFTGPHSQLVLMAIQPGDEIGSEVHEEHDQFIRIESGTGQAIIDDDTFDLRDGSAVVIPAGSQHNIINTSQGDVLKLYTIYTPPEHPDATIHPTKAEADAAEEQEHNHGVEIIDTGE